MFAKFTLDGPWVAIMTIGGDAIRDDTSHRSRRTEERFGGSKVPMLAQHYLDERTIAINNAIKVAPPSRPGESHPEPLTEPGLKPLDLSGSCHPLKAAASHRTRELLRSSVGSPFPMRVTPSLRSTGITPLHHYYGGVRPWLVHRYFRPRGFSHLCLFPSHHQSGSQVPCESLDQGHAFCTPDTTWPVGRYRPCSSRDSQ